MTEKNKEARLELVIRRNRGFRIRPAWIGSMRQACAVDLQPTDFLDISETELLKRTFYDRVRSESERFHKEWPRDALDQMLASLKNLAGDMRDLPVILFSSVDHYIGAVRLMADVVLSNAASVWEVVQEDLSLASAKMADGLCVELNFHSRAGQYVSDGIYGVTAWGIFAREGKRGG